MAAADDEVFALTVRQRKVEGEGQKFKINDAVFTYYPDRMPTMVIVDLGQLRINNDSAPMWELFAAVMPTDYERFRRMIRDPNLEFEPEHIKAIIEKIVGEGSERPT